MPDISLLQHEYYAPEEKESRLPGIASVGALIALIFAASAYGGLFFYRRVLISKVENIAKNITSLNAEEITQTTQEMKVLAAQARNLALLRTAHTYPTKLFAYLERITHPAVYFSDANINMKEKMARMKGSVASPVLLARQVEIYEKEKKEGRISDFTVTDIGYGQKKNVSFGLMLVFTK